MKLIRITLRWFITIAGVIALVILMFELSFHLWISGGALVGKPGQDIMLTAEYLYSNPNPIPQNLLINEDTKIFDDSGIICAVLLDTNGQAPYRWTRWFFNGERVPFEYYYIPFSLSTALEIRQPANSCLNIDKTKLSSGLHLVEIQFNTSPFYTDTSYQWAVKIEPTGTPTPSATPSAP